MQPQSNADRYVVLEYLAEGGMGAIYLGKKLGAGGFEKQVVLKQLLPEYTQQEEFIDLFLREAKLSATLDHANIVHTIDLVTAGQDYFIVMEYLPGGDLRTLMRRAKLRRKRISPAAAAFITREVLAALGYAHAKRDFDGKPLQLIHRDVSPSNVLISVAGEVKLTDFGIAKAATHTSLFYKVKGKVGYMSPEQAKSEPLDLRSDLYSIAVCLYELIAGERLFVANMTTSADEMYAQPIPRLAGRFPDVPRELDDILQRALAPLPDDRYQTASQFGEALNRCAHRNGLLMSGAELADELAIACGPPAEWRDDDDDDALPPRPGTAILPEDDDEIDFAAPLPAVRVSGGHDIRAFAGKELTSIISSFDDDDDYGGHRRADPASHPGGKPRMVTTGSLPLVQFDDAPAASGPGHRGPSGAGIGAGIGSGPVNPREASRWHADSPSPLLQGQMLPMPAKRGATATPIPPGQRGAQQAGATAPVPRTSLGWASNQRLWILAAIGAVAIGAIIAAAIALSSPSV